MKKLSGILFLFFLSATLFSQIPNNSFENWTTVGSYSMPDQWDNLNPSTTGAGIYTCTKGTPGNPGTAYLKLTSKTVSGMGVVPGIAVCGVLDQVARTPVSGFAFSQRPQNFTGKWQYMIYGIKPGYIDVTLSRWDVASGARIIVDSLHKVLPGMVMSWASFSLPLVYQDGQYPDTCMIFLSASGSSATNNDYLWLDNLKLEGTVTSVEPVVETTQGLMLFPNPARYSFTASFVSDGAEKLTLRLFDMKGRIVFDKQIVSVRGVNNITNDVKGIHPGLYTIKISSSSTERSGRIVIK